MKAGARAEASVHIERSPEEVYALVSDVTRMGEWSHECRAGEWIDGATGPAVGARFKGSSRRGIVRWSTKPTVITATPGREFAFVTTQGGHEESRWTYRFTPSAGGTTVTESFELLADLPWYLIVIERTLMRVKDRRADIEAGIRTTLQRLKEKSERHAPERRSRNTA